MRFALLDNYYKSNEYLKKLQDRSSNLKKMVEDPLVRHDMIVNKFSQDPIEFIEQFGWIKIPEFNNQLKPFFLFESKRTSCENFSRANRQTLTTNGSSISRAEWG